MIIAVVIVFEEQFVVLDDQKGNGAAALEESINSL